MSLHCSRSHHNLARRDRARLSTYHARLAISITEIARVSPHITLASQSRLQRSRASLSWSHSHRNLARRDRARLSTSHAGIAISLAEIARVSFLVTLASQSRSPRSRARLSTYHVRIPISLRRLCASLRLPPRIAISLAETARVSSRVTSASQSRSPRSRASSVSRPHRHLARRDRTGRVRLSATIPNP